MKALIVDDTIINIKVAQRLIEHEGLEVQYVMSGKECLIKVKDNKYDIIFMDIMMPEMDGIETFKKLQEIDGFNTPVIAITADAETGAKEKYLKLGFNNYIAKPIQIDILHNAISSLKIKK